MSESHSINVHELEKMKTKIEKMNKHHHIEILKILKNNPNVKLNENKSGVFVNLSFLPNNAIDEITKYIDYITDQENSIRFMESQQEQFQNAYFIEKEDKDNTVLYSSLIK
jgi:hypothetical protein